MDVFLVTILATGCQAAADDESKQAAPAETAQLQNKPKLTFGIIYPMAHPYYETITQNAKEAAQHYGINLIVKAPDEANLEQQIRMMETMIAQKVNGIAISPIDSNVMTPIINKAVQAGITVFCFESDAPGSQRMSYIGADNVATGKGIGKIVDQLLNGSGMIIVENGISITMSAKERLKGMLDYLEQNTSIQVLEVLHHEGSNTLALQQLEKMIDDHPHFDAFIALDYVASSTSILVWKATGLSRYALAVGMMPETKEAIRNGQITASLSQNEQKWGSLIIEGLYQAAGNRAVSSAQDSGLTEIRAVP